MGDGPLNPSRQPLLLLPSEAALGSMGLVHRGVPEVQAVAFLCVLRRKATAQLGVLSLGASEGDLALLPLRADPETAAAPDRGSEWVRPCGEGGLLQECCPQGCHCRSRAWVEEGAALMARCSAPQLPGTPHTLPDCPGSIPPTSPSPAAGFGQVM